MMQPKPDFTDTQRFTFERRSVRSGQSRTTSWLAQRERRVWTLRSQAAR
ncbi:MAG: hypothetical protein ABII00_05710 [Elusimicrobiota bacterium]